MRGPCTNFVDLLRAPIFSKPVTLPDLLHGTSGQDTALQARSPETPSLLADATICKGSPIAVYKAWQHTQCTPLEAGHSLSAVHLVN